MYNRDSVRIYFLDDDFTNTGTFKVNVNKFNYTIVDPETKEVKKTLTLTVDTDNRVSKTLARPGFATPTALDQRYDFVLLDHSLAKEDQPYNGCVVAKVLIEGTTAVETQHAMPLSSKGTIDGSEYYRGRIAMYSTNAEYKTVEGTLKHLTHVEIGSSYTHDPFHGYIDVFTPGIVTRGYDKTQNTPSTIFKILQAELAPLGITVTYKDKFKPKPSRLKGKGTKSLTKSKNEDKKIDPLSPPTTIPGPLSKDTPEIRKLQSVLKGEEKAPVALSPSELTSPTKQKSPPSLQRALSPPNIEIPFPTSSPLPKADILTSTPPTTGSPQTGTSPSFESAFGSLGLSTVQFQGIEGDLAKPPLRRSLSDENSTALYLHRTLSGSTLIKPRQTNKRGSGSSLSVSQLSAGISARTLPSPRTLVIPSPTIISPGFSPKSERISTFLSPSSSTPITSVSPPSGEISPEQKNTSPDITSPIRELTLESYDGTSEDTPTPNASPIEMFPTTRTGSLEAPGTSPHGFAATSPFSTGPTHFSYPRRRGSSVTPSSPLPTVIEEDDKEKQSKKQRTFGNTTSSVTT